ncbi:MAG TPA: PIG-L family deacetylase [Acidimicrobiia bacterium]
MNRIRDGIAPEVDRPTLVGVWAHPDDEAYLSAGLMARIAASGGRVVCVHATDGERGTPDPRSWPPSRLAPVRVAELTASLAALGVTESIRLGLPDGGLDALDGTAQAEALRQLLDDIAPDVIVTFGPDGMTGHPDHRTVSRWTTDAWRHRGRSGELLYATTTDGFVDRNRDLYERHTLVFEPGLPERTPPQQVALDVALDSAELDRKLVALRAHSSQTDAVIAELGADRFRHWFDHETFRRPSAAEQRRDAA